MQTSKRRVHKGTRVVLWHPVLPYCYFCVAGKVRFQSRYSSVFSVNGMNDSLFFVLLFLNNFLAPGIFRFTLCLFVCLFFWYYLSVLLLSENWAYRPNQTQKSLGFFLSRKAKPTPEKNTKVPCLLVFEKHCVNLKLVWDFVICSTLLDFPKALLMELVVTPGGCGDWAILVWPHPLTDLALFLTSLP